MDSLPPATAPSTPPAVTAPAYPPVAPGDIYPRSGRERDLCKTASHPDWWYLSGLLAVDAAAVWYGTWPGVRWNPDQDTGHVLLRSTQPAAIGFAWGATVTGVWLSMPKCSLEWVGETPREGAVRESLALNLSLVLLAGATAPIVNAIAVGYSNPPAPTTLERSMHIVTAGVFGAAGAFIPLLLPPSTTAAAREIDKIRVGGDGRSFFLGYSTSF